MADPRRCERCNGATPPRMSRTRDESGLLVCEECRKMKTPDWTAGLRYVAAMGEGPEMERRVSEAISSIARVARAKRSGLSVTAHDSGDNAIINHCPFCGSGAVLGKGAGTVGCDFCHTNFTVQVQPAHPFMPQTVDGQPIAPAGLPGEQPTEMSAPLDPAVNEVEEGVVEEATDQTPFNAPKADEPAKEEPKKENPFAKGSAKTAAQGCSYSGCNADAKWRIKAARWERVACDEHKGAYESQDGASATSLTSTAAYRTTEGHTLDEDSYIARLALAYADEREDVLDSVRTAHVLKAAADATVTCPRCNGSATEPDGTDLPCSSCEGTGLVWVAVPGVEAKQADLLNPATHIDDDERDLLDHSGLDTNWDEDLLLGVDMEADAPSFVPGPTAPWLRDERGGFYS